MSQATILGHSIYIENIENAKLKRILMREVRLLDGCLFSNRHEDHTDRYSKYGDHTDRYGDHSDHYQCGQGG
jgi:hypothetical protein